jgi:hypothetical protein
MKIWFDGIKPIHPAGWLVYISGAALLVWDFRAIDQTSRSASDTMFNFFPHVAGVFLLVALIIRARRSNPQQ